MGKNYLSVQAREHNKALAKKEEDMKKSMARDEKNDGAACATTTPLDKDEKKCGWRDDDGTGDLLPLEVEVKKSDDEVEQNDQAEIVEAVEAHGMARVLGLRQRLVLEAAVAAGGVRDEKGRLYVTWNKLGAWGGMMGRSERLMLEAAKKVRAPLMKDGMEYAVVSAKPGMNRMVRAESVAAGSLRRMRVKVRDPRTVFKGDELLVNHGSMRTEAVDERY